MMQGVAVPSEVLKGCPICSEKVTMEDCTRNEVGWNGFRIICRECKLQMYSDPVIITTVDYTTRAISTKTRSVTEIVLELVQRWNHRS